MYYMNNIIHYYSKLKSVKVYGMKEYVLYICNGNDVNQYLY